MTRYDWATASGRNFNFKGFAGEACSEGISGEETRKRTTSLRSQMHRLHKSVTQNFATLRDVFAPAKLQLPCAERVHTPRKQSSPSLIAGTCFESILPNEHRTEATSYLSKQEAICSSQAELQICPKPCSNYAAQFMTVVLTRFIIALFPLIA